MTYRLLNAKNITLFYFEIYSFLTSQKYTQLEDLFQCVYRRPDTFKREPRALSDKTSLTVQCIYVAV